MLAAIWACLATAPIANQSMFQAIDSRNPTGRPDAGIDAGLLIPIGADRFPNGATSIRAVLGYRGPCQAMKAALMYQPVSIHFRSREHSRLREPMNRSGMDLEGLGHSFKYAVASGMQLSEGLHVLLR